MCSSDLLGLGADAFALKPLEPDALLALIRAHLGRAGTAASTPAGHDESVVLRQYNAVLIHKLEQKMAELEAAEARARLGEDRLALALEVADAGIWDWDLGSGRIVWNEAHARLFGLKPEQFDGGYETFRRCVHPDDIQAIEEKIERARSRHVDYVHEFRVVWPDGSIHWIAGRGRFILDARGTPQRMCGVVTDISERKRAETALAEQKEFLNTVLESEPECVKVIASDGKLLQMNRAGLEMLEVDRDRKSTRLNSSH